MSNKKNTEKKKLAEIEQKEDIFALMEAEERGLDVEPAKTRSIFKDRVDAAGVNTQFMIHTLELATLPKVDSNDAEAVRERILEYFEICMRNDKKPSIEGLSLAFGVDRHTLANWRGKRSTKSQAVREVINWAYITINSQIVDYAQDGKMNTLMAFFLMRNNLGYTNNDVPIENTDDPMGEKNSGVEIAEKYQDLVED